MSDKGSFSIRVVERDGDPVEGANDSYQCGRISGVGTERTDDEGWVKFSIIAEVIGSVVIPIRRIWVNGVEVSDNVIYPEDGDSRSLCLPK